MTSLSFVIPAVESDIEKHLYDCLDSIKDIISTEDTSNEDIIVVIKPEQSSEDEIQEKIIGRYDDLVRYEFSSCGLSMARNIGLKMAKNNIITFLDSDTRINRGFISATIKDFEEGYGYVNYSARPLEEEMRDKRRLYFYTRFMNLNQWFYTHMQIHRPYGFCMSVKKDICEHIAEDGEVFLARLSRYGEDAEFGSRYGTYCRKNRIPGKYEKNVIVNTSLREWYKWGFWRGGARMAVNTFIVPYLKRPVVANWR